jgi:hypothetical protein
MQANSTWDALAVKIISLGAQKHRSLHSYRQFNMADTHMYSPYGSIVEIVLYKPAQQHRPAQQKHDNNSCLIARDHYCQANISHYIAIEQL